MGYEDPACIEVRSWTLPTPRKEESGIEAISSGEEGTKELEDSALP